MVRTPYASYTLVDALNGLSDPFVLLAAGVPQTFDLLEDLKRLHVLHLNVLLEPIDVVTDYLRVLSWPG